MEWNKRYGGPRVDSEQSVVQTSDGGYAIASTAAFGTGSDDDQRLWLVKTDSAGSVQWNKTYGEQRVLLSSIVQTTDGGYAILGNTIIVGYGNAWLVKTDSNGNMQWNMSYTEIGWATAYALIQTNDGGYVMSGCKESYDGWLMKTDAYGAMVWSRSFVEVNNTDLHSVVQTNDGGYIAAGATQWPPFSGSVDTYVVKTDADGNITWSKEFGRPAGSWYYGRSVIQTGDGGYAFAGETDHWGNADFWFVKTDISGNLLWDMTYGGPSWDGAKSIVQTTDGGYVLSGQTNSFGAGDNDFWLVKTDTDGNMQWNETFGGAGDDGIGALVYDVGSSLVQTGDGGFALAGYTNSFSGDGKYEVWLIKLHGPTWIVDDDGPADFRTIQEAINAASNGDTIFVKNGTYSESIVLNKTLSLIGENAKTTILNGQDSAATICITADNAHVSGFAVTSTGTGILLRSSGCVLSGNNIASNGDYGISIDWGFSSNNVLTGNTITGSNYGICFNDDYNGCWFYNNTISENRVSDNANAGIILFGSYSMGDSSYNVISENTLENSTVGIQMMWGWYNTVSGNQVISSEDGICFVVNRYSTISENNIAAVNGDGVRLQGDWGYHTAYDCSYTAISGNEVAVENGNGVSISGCYSNTVSENDIATTNGSCVYLYPYRNYDYGTYEDYPSTYNLVSQNNLTSTDQNCIRVINSSSNFIYRNNLFAQYASPANSENSENLWDNDYPSGGNYWSGFNPSDIYSGSYQNETGSDKIGDLQYIIDVNNTDRYPLIYPLGYVPTPDFNHDVMINNIDLAKIALAYGSVPGTPNWNPYVDLYQDGKINILDLVVIAINFGAQWPPP